MIVIEEFMIFAISLNGLILLVPDFAMSSSRSGCCKYAHHARNKFNILPSANLHCLLFQNNIHSIPGTSLLGSGWLE